MIYFDTAYILKCYMNEDGSEEVRSLARDHERIACCEYGKIELFAAFHRAFREKYIDAAYFKTVVKQLRQDDRDGIWIWLPFNREFMNSVASAFESLPANVYLRAADAIHLKCAAVNSILSLYTNDVHLLKAADHFGVNARNVITSD